MKWWMLVFFWEHVEFDFRMKSNFILKDVNEFMNQSWNNCDIRESRDWVIFWFMYIFLKRYISFLYIFPQDYWLSIQDSENLFCDIPTKTIKGAFHILPKKLSGKSSTLHHSPMTWYQIREKNHQNSTRFHLCFIIFLSAQHDSFSQVFVKRPSLLLAFILTLVQLVKSLSFYPLYSCRCIFFNSRFIAFSLQKEILRIFTQLKFILLLFPSEIVFHLKLFSTSFHMLSTGLIFFNITS